MNKINEKDKTAICSFGKEYTKKCRKFRSKGINFLKRRKKGKRGKWCLFILSMLFSHQNEKLKHSNVLHQANYETVYLVCYYTENRGRKKKHSKIYCIFLYLIKYEPLQTLQFWGELFSWPQGKFLTTSLSKHI